MSYHASPLRTYRTRRSLTERARGGAGLLVIVTALVILLVAGGFLGVHNLVVLAIGAAVVAVAAVWWSWPAIRSREGQW